MHAACCNCPGHEHAYTEALSARVARVGFSILESAWGRRAIVLGLHMHLVHVHCGALLTPACHPSRQCSGAGPKMISQDEEDDLLPAAMSPDQLCDKSPNAQLQLLWLNFKVASRHLVRISNFEAQTEAELNPMHVVQNDETLSSIARACFFLLHTECLNMCMCMSYYCHCDGDL